MKIIILKKRDQWYWKLVARNGKILAHSETYSSRRMAIKTANLLSSKLASPAKIV